MKLMIYTKPTFKENLFSKFSCMFLNPNHFFSNLKSNCSNLYDMGNLQEQVKKTFCHQKFFRPFTLWMNCSSDWEKLLKVEAEGRESYKNTAEQKCCKFGFFWKSPVIPSKKAKSIERLWVVEWQNNMPK